MEAESKMALKPKNNIEINVPSDLIQYLLIIKYETLKNLRSRRLIIIIIILALVLGLVLIIPPAFGEEYPSDALKFASWFIAFTMIMGTSIIVLLCVTAFGSDALVSEFQHKTGYLLFPNPLKKGVILFGKFSASFLSSMIVLSMFFGVMIVAILSISGSLPGEIGLSFLFHVMYLLAALSVAYLISSIMKGSTGAMVLTFFLFFLILPIIDQVFTLVGAKPFASITFSSGIVFFILLKPYPVDTIQEISTSDGGTFELNVFYPEIALSLLVMFFYLMITFTITYFIFERKEMK